MAGSSATSERLPGVSLKHSGLPKASQTAWILVFRPPLETPID